MEKKARLDLEEWSHLRQQGRQGIAHIHDRPPPTIPQQRRVGVQGHELGHCDLLTRRLPGWGRPAGEEQDMRFGGGLIGVQLDMRMLLKRGGAQVHIEAPACNQRIDCVHGDVGPGLEQRRQA